MNRKRLYLATAGAVFLLTGSSCNGPTSVDAAKALKKCAASESIPISEITYTGPVGVGPGARWIRFQSGLMQIGADVGDIFGATPANIYAPAPADAQCKIDTKSKIMFGADLGATVSTLPISAELQAKIGTDKKVDVSAEGFQWESIKIDVYNGEIAKLPDASPYKKPPAGRFTATSVLKVRGYTATVSIASTTDLGLSANFTGPVPGTVLSGGKVGLTAQITKEGKLELKVPGDSYVMAIFRPIGTGGQTQSATPAGGSAASDWTFDSTRVQGSRR